MSISEAAQNLITWVHAPTTLEDYIRYADVLTLKDCAALMKFEDKTVARIAWLEYGQKQGFAAFDLRFVRTPVGELHATLDPLRVTHTPILAETFSK